MTPLASLSLSLEPLSLSLHPYSPSALSPFCDQTEPPPPTSSLADTGHPTQTRRAQKLRHVVFFIFDEPRKPGGPGTSPSPSSSTSGSDHRRR